MLFSAFGLALLEPVAVLLGATPELLPSCLLYGRILLTFQTAFMLQYLFQSFFIAAEKPKLGLFFTVAAGVTNMVLDFVLVGVAGLGLAGATVQSAGAVQGLHKRRERADDEHFDVAGQRTV